MKKVHKKRIKKLLVTLFLLAVIGLIVFLSWSVKKFFVESSLFVVKKISTNLDSQINSQVQGMKLPAHIINTNLFAVDIKDISAQLKNSYPQYKDIVVKRQFPDTLRIDFVRRMPLFQIKLDGRYWFVDEEYVVIDGPHPSPYPDMVMVQAVLPKRMDVFAGKKISFSHADRVSLLLDELGLQDFLGNFNISRIDAYSLNDIWFDLDGVEIRVGADDYAKKLSLLKRLILPRFKNDFERIEYIDLRFKDYVVGYKR
jgi:cell division septal protein FtsQ